jgi:hypothetical protein
MLISLAAVMAFVPVGDTLVNVGSPSTPFSQNKQNEPALAVDANHPNILVAGANDNIDMEACNAGDDTTCPFTDGVGVSGVYFSFDSGHTWTQPTYTGWTARNCLGAPGPDPGCTAQVGPIGTLPLYYEAGLVSDGDPAVAFGPVPDAQGHFAWANGSRLYYANLTSNFSAIRSETAFKGFEAIAVSRTDDVRAAAAGSNAAWKPPVLVSKQSSTTFTDKEQVWADNAETSPNFGNVYVCWADFRSNSHGRAFPTPLEVATSTDGGDTWTVRHASPATDNGINSQPDGCTVRTDSNGVVYVFGIATRNGVNYESLTRSFDGGKHFTNLQLITSVGDVGVFDPVIGRPTEDGVAGARNDLATAPSADIANGSPTGADATNEIVMTYTDGIDGLNHEHARITWSTDGGNNWSTPASIEQPGDRSYYVAPAISPDGSDVYVVYNAWLTPYQTNTSTPRLLAGVVRHADVAGNGSLTSWTTLHRGSIGDARGSSQNNLAAEFLGDYVYAVATRTYGAAVWNDVRNAADCPAMDAWRQSLRTGGSVPRPAPEQDCPSAFGNSDIFGGSFPDPTP